MCLIIPALLRLWFGMLVGVWFPAEQACDDALMISYADLRAYLVNRNHRDVMLKDIGLPFVYQITKITHIPYTAIIAVLWIFTALIAFQITYKLTCSRKQAFLFYIFILFQPSAFDNWCGTRLYRAAILNPLYFLTIFLAVFIMLELGSDQSLNFRKLFGQTFAFGIILSLTYYIKEDGIWLFMTVMFVMIFWWITAIRNRHIYFQKKTLYKSISILALPIVIFVLSTLGYKTLNYHYFGVFETNMRTSGEPMKFVENIYKIEAEGQTDRIWASKDAIAKAFEASPTLQSVPELKRAIFHSGWLVGNIDEYPLDGDRLTWVLKDAIMDTEIATKEAQKQAFFKKVNRELEESFKTGKLKKDRTRIHLLSSIGGISKEGLIRACYDAVDLYRRHIILDGYVPGASFNRSTEHEELYEKASIFTNLQLTAITTETGLKYKQQEKNIANMIIAVIFGFYRIVFPVMIVLAFVGLVMGIYRIASLRKAKNNQRKAEVVTLVLLALGMLGCTAVYNYIIAVYCFTFAEEFIPAEIMYSIGFPSMMCMFVLLGCSLITPRKVVQCANESW